MALSNYKDAGALAGRRADTATESEPARDADRPDVWAGRRVALIVVSCYLAGALILTWRLWADPASRIVAGNATDADLFAWYMRYAASAVGHGRLPALVTSAMNAPVGVNMLWNTSVLLLGVLLTPVTLLFGPQVSLTILTTAGFAGSAAALFWVLRRWGVSVGAAALAGAVYGFSPAMVHSALEHYNLQFAVLPPLIIDAGLCLALGPPPSRSGRSDSAARPARVPAVVRDGTRLGLLLAAQLFISEELALITAIAGVLLAIGLAVPRPREAAHRIGPAVAGLLIAGTVAFVLAGRALVTQFAGPLVQRGPLFPLDYYVNDPVGFVTPSSYLLFHSAGTAAAAARYQGGATEYLAYLGWPLIVVLVLATVASWRRPAGRALALTLAVLVVLSFGGHPLVWGTPNPAITLPWHWLEEHQLFASVLPDRISIVADGVAAALLALGIDAAIDEAAEHLPEGGVSARAGPGGRSGSPIQTAIIAVAVLGCLPLIPRPMPAATAVTLPSGWNRALTALHLPAGAAVLVIPVPTNILTAAMRWQADTGRPASFVGGYFIGPGAGDQAYIGGTGVRATAWYLDRLWAAGLPPSSPFAGAALAAGLATATPAGPVSAGAAPAPSQMRSDLAAWHPAAVVAVTAASSPLASYLVGLLGPPVVQSGTVIAWRR